MPFDTTLDPTTDIILGAIDYLEQYRWCQYAAVRGNQRCVWGALREVAGESNRGMLDAACRRVEQMNNIPSFDLQDWNDVRGRTKDQVLDALRNSLGHRE